MRRLWMVGAAVCALVAGASGATAATRVVRVTGGTAESFGNAIAIDARGDLVTTGYTSGRIPGAADSFKGGFWDAFVTKYSQTGTLLWSHLIGTSQEDVGYGVATDAKGNVYVGGGTQGQLCGDHHATDDWDAFVVAFSPQGQRKWCRTLGSSGIDRLFALTSDANGDVTAAGDTTGHLAGAPERAAGSEDAFFARFDASGHVRAVHQLGGNLDDYARGVAVDTQGNTYLAGGTNSLHGKGDPTFGYFDAFVAVFSPTDQLEWLHTVGTPVSSDDDEGDGVAVDSNGGVYLVGYTEGHIVGAPERPANALDGFVTKFGASGKRQWSHQLAAPIAASASGVTVRPNGDVTVVGSTDSALPHSHPAYAGGDLDGLVVTFRPDGSRVDTTLIGTSGTDEIDGVASRGGATAFVGTTTGHFPDAQRPTQSADTAFVIRVS